MSLTETSTICAPKPIRATISQNPYVKTRLSADDLGSFCNDQVEVSSENRLAWMVQVERELVLHSFPLRRRYLSSKRSCPLFHIPERPSNPMAKDYLFDNKRNDD